MSAARAFPHAHGRGVSVIDSWLPDKRRRAERAIRDGVRPDEFMARFGVGKAAAMARLGLLGLRVAPISWGGPMSPSFDGKTFSQERDGKRLATLLMRVQAFMMDGRRRTLREIAGACHGSEGGVGARLRDFNKPRFHHLGFEMESEHVEGGLWVYWLTPRHPARPVQLELVGADR